MSMRASYATSTLSRSLWRRVTCSENALTSATLREVTTPASQRRMRLSNTRSSPVCATLVRPLVDAGHLHQRHHTQQGGEQHHRQKSRSQLDTDAQIGNSHGSPFTLRLPKRHFDACQSVLLSTAYL